MNGLKPGAIVHITDSDTTGFFLAAFAIVRDTKGVYHEVPLDRIAEAECRCKERGYRVTHFPDCPMKGLD